ncbi:MAG: rod shape-determining protein [Chloroflexi bacterium]|nr:rod shape-determining protein [Chloroflexota bacterium]
MFTQRIGIDLGTANVLVFIKGKGIVVREPSVVAIAPKENKVLAVGAQAKSMLGRTPGSIQVVRPMRAGVIADYLVTEAMLRHFIQRVGGPFRLGQPEVIVSIPAGATPVEKRAVREAAEAAGARKPAHLVPEPLAAALGAEMPVHLPQGNMVVDLGGGRAESAIISMYGIVVSESVRVAGDSIDDAIAAYVKRRHNLVIGDRTAEEIKIEIGSALPIDDLCMEVRGRDQITGLPRTVTVHSKEITTAISDSLNTILAMVKTVLERTPPELVADVIDQGIVLTGGGALLRNIEKFLSQETGVPCQAAEEPMNCVARGAGLALEHLDLIKRNLPTEEESLAASY